MADPAERQRTVLRAPRAEFDLSALALGAGGWLAYQWSWPALAAVLGVQSASISAGGGPALVVQPWHRLRWEFFNQVVGRLQLPFADRVGSMVGAPGTVGVAVEKDGKTTIIPYQFSELIDGRVEAWKLVVVGVWLFLLWSIVAGAISRVYAVRIARDESIGAGNGLAFALSNLKSFVLAPLFVATWAAIFVALAALAGVASAVPVAGPFLEIVAHPLALVAGLVALVVATGGIFGLPVMQAAVATERNGALDAMSRTFSYAFTRPVAYVASLAIVTTVAGLLSIFGSAFIAWTTRAMHFGAGLVSDAQAAAIGGGAQFAVGGAGVLGWPQVEKLEGAPLFGLYVSWAFTALAAVLVNGYVLSYFVGGLTDTYFLLRRDVDGIDESEVYLEGEEPSLGEPLPGEPTPPRATS